MQSNKTVKPHPTIPFNRPPRTGNEEKYVLDAMEREKISGDGFYSRLCQSWFENQTNCKKALLTPSCTHALELAAILIDIQPGDEVIMPSYTFVSTANAFALRGAKIVFIDVRPDTMNLDAALIEQAITSRTKAIVPVHYAGVSCEMEAICDIAARYSLTVIEDAAQGMMSSYKNQAVGSFGHLAAFSFHETKNFTSGGEGGVLLINDESLVGRAEVIREKGTNRSRFFRGMVDKYTWVDLGSSFLLSDIQAAYLWGQLEVASKITLDRLATWDIYHQAFKSVEGQGRIIRPSIPRDCDTNGHMYYLKCTDERDRTALIDYLKDRNILAVFHYVPLHSAPAANKFSRFHGKDVYTTLESSRLVRLPLWYDMPQKLVQIVIDAALEYLNET